ncbi:hypothetical protein SPRG_02440 [Saprolegnia parasitica CBS 223.65]|uniref:Uncharacterized protein n=1 Tax=Saprolegnia parasitica (strain CBS 223.65) TaxID=695850 RepID=A0A067D138_SAPPC|nr:hypothetical protein SPRG_02440 [Saprolegnia parasitica CBS 223.65]KDO32742.1 hypothetical protein SPRG_02440 [Saprolegnia parasitica CBS 223.65]|eukprot:XP_012196406.1 hypothetical protein SPRG_02440 [Saprolegnia parasitica CBS 223.65]
MTTPHVDAAPGHGHGGDAKRTKVTLVLDAAIDDKLLMTPSFRYKFIDGSKKATPPVGTWAPAIPPHAVASTTVEASPKLAVVDRRSSRALPVEGGSEPLPELKLLRYEHHVPDMEITEAMAIKLHENPIVTFFLVDHSPSQATAVSGVGRNFLSFFEVDLSPLLGGDTTVECAWGELPKESSLSPCVPFIPAAGLRSFIVRIKTDHGFLPAKRAQALNPLTLHLRKATHLPGITVSAKPLYQYITPTPFTALTKCCAPAYASMRFLNHRLVRTPGLLQGKSVAWQFKTTFLCGHFEWLALQESFAAGHVLVEVHDRDVRLEKAYEALVHKWEGLVAGKQVGDEHARPLDIFAVDDIAKADIQTLFFQQAGDRNAHGVATFRFYELLNTTHLRPNHEGPFLQLKFAADIVQHKRRQPPKEGTDDAEDDLSQVEKLVRVPGAYLSHNSTMHLGATLGFPLIKPTRRPSLQAPADRSLFSRLVLVVPYDDTESVQAVSRAMEKVNGAALPGAPLRSYQLTPMQKQAADAGDLNILTGFQVLDTDLRMIVLEGLAEAGMAVAHASIPRRGPNVQGGYHMFANHDVRFSQRLYSAFDVDLKRIKLRDPLPDIIKRPELYMRSKVSENCFQALNRLQNVRKASRLAELRDLDLFPLVSMLLEVESKYGESITLEDIHGVDNGHVAVPRRMTLDCLDKDVVQAALSSLSATKHHSPHSSLRLKAATDASNPAYDQAKREWQPRDYVDERRREKAVADEAFAAAKANEPPRDDAPVYIYSGQKLRTQDLEKDAMRARLAKDRHATFTDSEEFNSLTWSLVDENRLAQIAESTSKALYTTPSGFVYPPPRQPSEFYKHEKAPSAARCEELSAPWIENLYHPQPVERDTVDVGAKAAFDSLPSKDMIFGGTNADGTPNVEYFKSVHLVGDGLAKEMEDAKAKEHQEWLDKLVVDHDNLRFIAHGDIMGQGRTKPSPLDKPRDILDGPPLSKPIRIVRNAKLPSGKAVRLTAAPVSILCGEAYSGGAKAQLLRTYDPTGFVAQDDDGRPKDFLFPSVTEILVPRVNRHTTVLKPRRELTSAERTGLIWKNMVGTNQESS